MKTLQLSLALTLVLILGAGAGLADTVTLQSQDGQDFKVELKVAKQSETIKNLIEDAGIDAPIPIPNIMGKTLARIIDFLKAERAQKNLNAQVREFWGAFRTSDLIEIAGAINYLNIQIRDANDLLGAVLKIYGDRIFSDGQVKWVFENEAAYAKYFNETLKILKDMQRIVIAQSLGSIDRIFLNNTKDRRIAAIQQTPLDVAQIVAYIGKHNTPRLEDLPKHWREALKQWGHADKILFGPVATEFATWPAHCQLPGHPDYNMYADDTPDERFVDNGDGTVTDRCTLLMWEKEPSTHPLPLAPANGHCWKLEKANYEDWRLPKRVELQSIVDYTKREPASNPVFAGANGGFWSSAPAATDINRAWYVSFILGEVKSDIKADVHGVRCVRPPSRDANVSEYRNKKATVEHYTLGRDSVIDNFTGLEWQRYLRGRGEEDFNNARSLCGALDLAGSKDFRMPMVKELSTLVDLRSKTPALDDSAFPYTPFYFFSSSTLRAGDAKDLWGVVFANGIVIENPVNVGASIRCVR
jgi:hypothetical protein